jgi:hypothetical protein
MHRPILQHKVHQSWWSACKFWGEPLPLCLAANKVYNKAQRSHKHFYKGLNIIEPNLANFSPTKTGELTIAPVLTGKLHPLLQLHAERSFTRTSQFFL